MVTNFYKFFYYFAFTNQRLLGKIGITNDKDKYIIDKNLGFDALDLNYSKFKNLIKGKNAMVKSILMNHEIIAGIGNIYSDEILFQSEIHPKAVTKSVDEKKLKEIYYNIKYILNIAINKKVNINDFPRNFIIHNREKKRYLSKR